MSVKFPLTNVRKTVNDVWDQNYVIEPITVPSAAPYDVKLLEVPDNGFTNNRPTIAGLTESLTYPPVAGTFYINYNNGYVAFNASESGQTYDVKYWQLGSLVEAEDINYLYEEVTTNTSDIANVYANVLLNDDIGVKVLPNTPHFITFNIAPSGVPDTEGTIYWDEATHLPIFKSDIATPSWNAGTEDWVRVRNLTGVPIQDGTAVVGVSSTDDIFNVEPALAVPGPLAGITGVVTADILHGEEGWATTRGLIHNIDTSGWAAMDALYVSPLSAGHITNIEPTPPSYPIPIGFAMNSQVDGLIYLFVGNPVEIMNSVDAAVATGDPTGWHNGDAIVIDYNYINRTATLTGDLTYSWRGQVKSLTSPWTSEPHPDILDDNYFLYTNDGQNFIWTSNLWMFTDMMVMMAWYYTNDKGGAREAHGLMPWQVHEEFHRAVSTYRESGGTLSNYVLSSTTPVNRRPFISQTIIKDEDCRTTLPASSSSLYTKVFLTGSGNSNFTVRTAEIVPLLGTNPYYNQFVSPNWVQTLMPNNTYMSVWLVVLPVTSDTNSQNYRYLWVQGQSVGELINQEALFPSDLNLGSAGNNFSEYVFIAKVIVRYTSGDWRINKIELLTGTKSSTVGSPAGVYLSTVAHDTTVTGDGTTASPLSVAHNTTSGLNTGDYRHLTALAKNHVTDTKLITDSTTTGGIQVDAQGAPSWGWRDITSDLIVRVAGANDPIYSLYMTGIYAHKFALTSLNELYINFHMPHDYVIGTHLFIHIHWSQAIVDTGTSVQWFFDFTYAKRDTGAFPPIKTLNVVQTAGTVAYQHRVAEVQISNTGGDVTHINTTDLEPDGLLLCRIWHDGSGLDTLTQQPYAHFVDMHYQSNNMGTKNNSFPFHTV